MSSVWRRDCVLVDLNGSAEEVERIRTSYHKLPFMCALVPHFLQHNIVFTCNRRTVWITCVCVLWDGVGVVRMVVSIFTRCYNHVG